MVDDPTGSRAVPETSEVDEFSLDTARSPPEPSPRIPPTPSLFPPHLVEAEVSLQSTMANRSQAGSRLRRPRIPPSSVLHRPSQGANKGPSDPGSFQDDLGGADDTFASDRSLENKLKRVLNQRPESLPVPEDSADDVDWPASPVPQPPQSRENLVTSVMNLKSELESTHARLFLLQQENHALTQQAEAYHVQIQQWEAYCEQQEELTTEQIKALSDRVDQLSEQYQDSMNGRRCLEVKLRRLQENHDDPPCTTTDQQLRLEREEKFKMEALLKEASHTHGLLSGELQDLRREFQLLDEENRALRLQIDCLSKQEKQSLIALKELDEVGQPEIQDRSSLPSPQDGSDSGTKATLADLQQSRWKLDAIQDEHRKEVLGLQEQLKILKTQTATLEKTYRKDLSELQQRLEVAQENERGLRSQLRNGTKGKWTRNPLRCQLDDLQAENSSLSQEVDRLTAAQLDFQNERRALGKEGKENPALNELRALQELLLSKDMVIKELEMKSGIPAKLDHRQFEVQDDSRVQIGDRLERLTEIIEKTTCALARSNLQVNSLLHENSLLHVQLQRTHDLGSQAAAPIRLPSNSPPANNGENQTEHKHSVELSRVAADYERRIEKMRTTHEDVMLKVVEDAKVEVQARLREGKKRQEEALDSKVRDLEQFYHEEVKKVRVLSISIVGTELNKMRHG